MTRLAEPIFKTLLAAMLLVPGVSFGADGDGGEGTVPPTYYGDDRLDAKAVGVTGGAIVGAEAVIAVQAAVGVDKLWPYLVFPVLGAAGGGVGGYFLEKASPPGAVAMLVTGIALMIPTAILTASAFAYDPEKDGAAPPDSGDEQQYSFEMPPDEEDLSGDYESETVTDVEKQPDVGPPADGSLSPEPSPYSEEPGGENAPDSSESGASETPPGSSLRLHRTRDSRSAVLSGALLNVTGSGAFGVSVPFVDVRPLAVLSDDLHPDGSLRRAEGVEFHIPLLRVDLP